MLAIFGKVGGAMEAKGSTLILYRSTPFCKYCQLHYANKVNLEQHLEKRVELTRTSGLNQDPFFSDFVTEFLLLQDIVFIPL